MIIPKTIEIGPVRYDVLQRWQPLAPRVGSIDYNMLTISLNTAEHTGLQRPRRLVTKTFWHETVHGILHDMGHTLRDDEVFVDAFAKRLTQVTYSAVLP